MAGWAFAMRFSKMPAISRRSRLVTDLVSSTALSRRNFLAYPVVTHTPNM